MAKKLIDTVFEPNLRTQIEALNRAMAKFNIQAGVELTWFFDRIDTEQGDDKA